MEWLPLIEFGLTTLSGILIAVGGWFLSTLYAELRELVAKHHALATTSAERLGTLSERLAVLETRLELAPARVGSHR